MISIESLVSGLSREYHESARIIERRKEASDIISMSFDTSMPEAKPGQFLMVWIPGVGERPLSISSANPLEIVVKKIGKVTERLFDPALGEVFIRGPYGRPFPIIKNKHAYLIGGGCGVAPLRFLSQLLPRESQTVLMGARGGSELACLHNFISSSDKLLLATDDGTKGKKGFVIDLFDDIEPERNSVFYICGPEKMMVAAANLALKYTDAENIFLSTERYMKCGRGVCGSCEMDGYRTCVDGPVFSFDQIRNGDFGKCKRVKSGKRVSI
jgi:dihydroorotate dehydrogenase electron transfer subunit